MNHLRRSFLPLIALVAITLGARVWAGPVDASHVFERVGTTPTEVAAVTAPGRGRLLVLRDGGALHLVSGDGLLDEVLGTVPVDTGCPGGGLLDAAWSPTASNELFVSHRDATSSRLAVARLTLVGSRIASSEVVVEVALAPSCDRVGGGLVFDASGRLLLGVGDHGDTVAAADPASPAGKILRFEADGSVPVDSPSGGLVHARGFRDPVRIVTDSVSGESWVLDLGPGDSDEVNRVVADADHGWPTGAGRLAMPGLTDPVHVWSPASAPRGLLAYRGDDLPEAEQGDLLVALGDGRLVQLREPLGMAGVSEERPLYVPEAGEPSSFADVGLGSDGHVYLVEADGGAHRWLRSSGGPLVEPSPRDSVVPLFVSRTGTGVEVGVERRPGADELGLYVGSLGAGATTHGDTTDLVYPVEPADGEATTRFEVDVSVLDARGGDAAYFVVSARGTAGESGVGTDSAGTDRPGGNVLNPTCMDPCEGTVGRNDGDCAPGFTLEEGVEGSGNVIGPVNFFADYTCRVILIHIGAEW
ncbi:MAG: PQQ-dependent sugar dehydrogenase [Acidobacteriota bacterium]